MDGGCESVSVSAFLRPKAPEMQGAYVKTCIRFCPLAGQGCPFFGVSENTRHPDIS